MGRMKRHDGSKWVDVAPSAKEFDEHKADETTNAHSISNISGLQSALNGKEPAFTKNTAFNKNFGTTAGTVAQGNHTHNGYSRIAQGTYTGNTAERYINVGFPPKMVIILRPQTSTSSYSTAFLMAPPGYAQMAIQGTAIQTTYDNYLGLYDNGFRLTTLSNATWGNASGNTYEYIAFG